MNPNARGSVAI